MPENSIRFQKSIVFCNNKMLIRVGNDIRDYLLTDGLLFILIDGGQAGIEQNIYCYDLNGNFLWQIEKPDIMHFKNYFTSIYLSEKSELHAYNINGIEYIIAKQTGRILKKELVK